MAEDRLRLQAEVIDRASAPLAKIREQLAAFKATPHMKELHADMEKLRAQATGFMKDASALGGSFSGIGIQSLAASVSVGALVKSYRDLAARSADLKSLGRETGLTVDAVNQLQHVAERFHVAPEKMGAGLQFWANAMTDLRRGHGDLKNELDHFYPGLSERMAKELPTDALRDYEKVLADLSDKPQTQRRWASLGFGDPDIARVFAEGYKNFSDAMNEAARDLPKMTQEALKAAEAFDTSIIKFNTAIETLETRTGPAIFKQLTTEVDDMRVLFDKVQAFFAGRDGLGLKKAGDDKPQSFMQWLQDPKGQGSIGEAMGSLAEWLAKTARNAASATVGSGPGGGSPFGGLDSNAFPSARPGDPNYHPAAFRIGGGTIGANGPQGIVQAGVRAGVVQGLLDFAQMRANGGGAATGLQNASFSPAGHAAFGRMRVISGGGGGAGPIGAPNLQGADPDTVAYIRESATRHGIDPNYALRVASTEGLYKYTGDAGTSFGPFQLHYRSNIPGYTSAGMGDDFTRQTGKHARDPSTVHQQIDFAMAHAAQNGWGAWHGWRGGRWDGIGRAGGGHVSGVNPVMQEIIRRASATLGDPLSIGSGYRSPEHNRAVGGAPHSLHMMGYAADLSSPGHAKGETAYWSRVASAMRQAAGDMGQPIRWGGRFTDYRNDNNHFDLTHGGPTQRAIEMLHESDRRHRDAGSPMTIKHDGGADITVRIPGLSNLGSVESRSRGLIKSVKLRRASTMPDPRD